MEVTKLFEDNTRLKIEIEKITKDSIIQRGKLIAERDKLKAESAQNPNRYFFYLLSFNYFFSKKTESFY